MFKAGSDGRMRRRYTAIVLTAVVGMLVTIAAFVLVLSWEYRLAEIDFQSRAKSYLEVINADLGDANTLLYTIGAFIGANDHPVSANEFAHFSAALHRRVVGFRDTAWAPRVTLAERPLFEHDARLSGFAAYGIKQFGPHHKLIPATRRDQYYPLLYIAASAAKHVMLGFDLVSEKARARAALRALQTGQPAATPPMDVVTVKQPGAGILSYMAVHASRGSRGQLPMGLVLGAFDIPAMVQDIRRKNTAAGGLDLYLFNPAAKSTRRVLYRSPPTGSAAPPSERELLAGTNSQSIVFVIDQPIGAIVTPVRPLHFMRWSPFGISTLAVGFTITALIVAYLLLSLRRTLELEALTTNLRATAVELHEKTVRITEMSRHDALTELPNRVLFGERVDQALARFHRGGTFSLLLLDLDRFKAVNDTLGHNAGDQLLCAVAKRLTAALREVDTAARLGGDEFAIVLADISELPTVGIIANRLIDSLSRPYTIDGQTVLVGVSIGAATSTPGSTAKSLLAQADLAMYEAKRAGRGRFRFFEPRLQASASEKQLLEEDLRRGMACKEIEINYKPVINLARNEVTSFEALVHWNHPLRGKLAYEIFTPVAEKCELFAELGSWVLRVACEDAASWPADVNVAVNVSPMQFRDPTFVATVQECLAASGLPPQRLGIELTEPAFSPHAETALSTLTELRGLGVTVVFDNFGTGDCALSSLLRLPFDKIKIDRALLERIDVSSSAAAVTGALVRFGTGLGLITTGQGVETAAQLHCLRGFGCDEAQGPFLGPARPNAKVLGLLRSADTRSELCALATMTNE